MTSTVSMKKRQFFSNTREKRYRALIKISLAGSNHLDKYLFQFLFSCSVVSDSFWPHGLQHARLPCPSPTLGACSNSFPSSRWGHPTPWSSVIPFHLLPSIFPSIRVFASESVLHMRWPKYWSFSFSISPFNEYSGLISFRIYWFDLLAVQGSLKSLLQHHSSKASLLQCSTFLFGPTLTSIMTTGKTIASTIQTVVGFNKI